MKISPFIFESITPTNKTVQGMNSHICDQSMGVFYIELWLVGGRPTPLKNMSSSVGMITPNIWKNKKCSKPPTRWD
jgi:hypothetical protein